jgi:DNA-binding MarR family transcriptional regulator
LKSITLHFPYKGKNDLPNTFRANNIWATELRQANKGGAVGKASKEHMSDAKIHAREAETFISPDETFSRVLQLVRRVQTGMQSIEGIHGLSGSQLWALWHVSAHPGIRVSDIAKAMHIRHSTASNLLDRLEQRALIQRQRQTDDTRVVRVFLTDPGIGVICDTPGPLQGHLRAALHGLPHLELIGLHRGLTNLLSAMDSHSNAREHSQR